MAKQHAKLSASSAHRWLACPGSIRLSEGIPPTTSKYADEGTAAHELCEICLIQKAQARDYLGRPMYVKTPKGQVEFIVTEEMADAVQVYLDAVRNDMKEAGVGEEELYIEQSFKLDWLYPGLFGRNDAMVAEPFGVLRVYDYKHGAGVAVEVRDNPQELYYGLGAIKDSRVAGGYEEVELIIVQPRAHHPDGPVRRCRYTVKEVEDWGLDVLLPGASAASYPDAPLACGEHCRFCPALAVCPEQQKTAMEVAKEVFQPVPASPPAPEALKPEDLKKILGAADLIEAWLNACRLYVKTLLETGKATSEQLGYKLVAGRKTRSWANAEDAEAWLKSLIGDSAYTPRELLSVAQAEKALKEVAFLYERDDFTRRVAETVNGNQLVPVSDKRTAVQPAISAFSEVFDL